MAESIEPLWQSTEFVAAIFGAIVGGVIPLLAQIFSEQRGSRKRDHATAIGLFFKLMDINTSVAHIRAHLENGARVAKKDGISVSAATIPLANHPVSVPISIDEKAVVMSFNDNGLLNDVLNLDRTYNATVPISAVYSRMREDVREIIREVPNAAGVVMADLSRDQFMRLEVLRFEMDQLLEGWSDSAVLDEHSSRLALAALVLHIRRLYNPHFELTSLSIVKR